MTTFVWQMSNWAASHTKIDPTARPWSGQEGDLEIFDPRPPTAEPSRQLPNITLTTAESPPFLGQLPRPQAPPTAKSRFLGVLDNCRTQGAANCRSAGIFLSISFFFFFFFISPRSPGTDVKYATVARRSAWHRNGAATRGRNTTNKQTSKQANDLREQ